MAKRIRDGAEGGAAKCETFVVEPLPFALLDAPLDYVLADHFRHRTLCAALRRCSDRGATTRDEADAVIAFMENDLPLHHEDEDADLFPLLRKRASDEDDLVVALARLRDDHRKSEALAREIVDALARSRGDRTLRLDEPTRELLRAFAAGEHRHLALENGVLLAIARVRLTRGDLAGMSRRMKARRGV